MGPLASNRCRPRISGSVGRASWSGPELHERSVARDDLDVAGLGAAGDGRVEVGDVGLQGVCRRAAARYFDGVHLELVTAVFAVVVVLGHDLELAPHRQVGARADDQDQEPTEGVRVRGVERDVVEAALVVGDGVGRVAGGDVAAVLRELDGHGPGQALFEGIAVGRVHERAEFYRHCRALAEFGHPTLSSSARSA